MFVYLLRRSACCPPSVSPRKPPSCCFFSPRVNPEIKKGSLMSFTFANRSLLRAMTSNICMHCKLLAGWIQYASKGERMIVNVETSNFHLGYSTQFPARFHSVILYLLSFSLPLLFSCLSISSFFCKAKLRNPWLTLCNQLFYSSRDFLFDKIIYIFFS